MEVASLSLNCFNEIVQNDLIWKVDEAYSILTSWANGMNSSRIEFRCVKVAAFIEVYK